MRRAAWVKRYAPWVGLALLGGLSCSTNVTGTLSLITGYNQADPFMMPPPPTSIQITSTVSDGAVTVLAQSALPISSGNLALPNENTSTTAAFTATGFDDAGDAVIWGETLPVEYSSLEGLSLPVFVQRTGQLSRLPEPLPAAPASPSLLTMLTGRFIVSIGSQPPGDAGASADASGEATTQIFDLLTWSPLSTPPTLPFAPVAIAAVGTQILLINGANTVWYDFSDSETSTPTLSAGSFSQITGGATVTDPTTGDEYVVGSAGGSLSDGILYVNASTQSITLPQGQTRRGAAATWTSSYQTGGVVIAGGSAIAPGVEFEVAGAQSDTLPFPPDPTVGAGAAALANGSILLVGGVTPSKDGGTVDAGVRLINLNQCEMGACVVTSWNIAFNPPLVSTQAFTLNPGTAADGGVSGAVAFVGNDASNNTHAFTVTQSGATPVPFNDSRQGATAVQLPFGPIAVVGGGPSVTSIESYPTP